MTDKINKSKYVVDHLVQVSFTERKKEKKNSVQEYHSKMI